MVKPDAEAFRPERFDHRLDEILAIRCLGRLVVAVFRIPETETLVMLGRDDEIFHPGGLGQARPLLGIVEVGIEVIEILLIVLFCDGLVLLDPYVPGREGIKAPVDEHAEPGISPPLYPGLALSLGFRARGRDRWEGEQTNEKQNKGVCYLHRRDSLLRVFWMRRHSSWLIAQAFRAVKNRLGFRVWPPR